MIIRNKSTSRGYFVIICDLFDPPFLVFLNLSWFGRIPASMSDTESKSSSKKHIKSTFVCPIAKPLADRSLEKKVLKLVKKGKPS